MIGAIAGDIIGSPYEFSPICTKDFKLFSSRSFFTDDTVLSVALADSILNNKNFSDLMKIYYRRYSGCGYGGSFQRWASSSNSRPYNSYGNGAAMRISPVGFAFDTLEDVLDKAKEYTEITHNHPDGIKGAQATAACIFLARKGYDKKYIKQYIESNFKYDLSKTIDQIRPRYVFNGSCQGTVPQSIISFLDSLNFEDAIRNAVSLGGDADTLACIAGGIAEAYYGVPDNIIKDTIKRLDDNLRKTALDFSERYCKRIKRYDIKKN